MLLTSLEPHVLFTAIFFITFKLEELFLVIILFCVFSQLLLNICIFSIFCSVPRRLFEPTSNVDERLSARVSHVNDLQEDVYLAKLNFSFVELLKYFLP